MSDLFQYLSIHPKFGYGPIFRYLKYDRGPHGLRGVRGKALIACTSRTGSSLLQVCLERYGLNVQEYLNPEGSPKEAFESGKAASLTEFANLLALTAVKNDWFVAKGAFESLLFLYYLGEIPEFTSEWKFIFLRRRNVVRQAISLEIATTTEQWTAMMPARRQMTVDDYSFDSINKRLESIFRTNDRWERAFGYLGVEPYRLYYEDFVGNTAAETEAIAKFFGIDVQRFPGAAEHIPWLMPQTSDINLEWERRFRHDFRGRITDRMHAAPEAIT